MRTFIENTNNVDELVAVINKYRNLNIWNEEAEAIQDKLEEFGFEKK